MLASLRGSTDTSFSGSYNLPAMARYTALPAMHVEPQCRFGARRHVHIRLSHDQSALSLPLAPHSGHRCGERGGHTRNSSTARASAASTDDAKAPAASTSGRGRRGSRGARAGIERYRVLVGWRSVRSMDEVQSDCEPSTGNHAAHATSVVFASYDASQSLPRCCSNSQSR